MNELAQATPSAPMPIAVAVVERDGEYLIGQRPAGASLPGLWEFPGGKINPGEAGEDAAIRECREETGITIRVEGLLAAVEHTYAHGQLRLHFYRCSPLGPAAEPTPPFRWVAAAALGDYRFPPANAQLIAMLGTRTGRTK